jgi:hypothetical protein
MLTNSVQNAIQDDIELRGARDDTISLVTYASGFQL